MRHVRIWTRVLGIPLAFEEPDNLKLVGNLLGGFVDYDKKEFFQGRCSVCWLVTHSGIRCEERPAFNSVARTLNFPHSASPPSYAFAAKLPGPLAEAASTQPKKKEKKKPVIPRLESAEAKTLPSENECTEIGLHGSILQDISLIGDDGGELGMTGAPVSAFRKAAAAASSRKRERQGHYTPSPKKLKTILRGKVPVLYAESLRAVRV